MGTKVITFCSNEETCSVQKRENLGKKPKREGVGGWVGGGVSNSSSRTTCQAMTDTLDFEIWGTPYFNNKRIITYIDMRWGKISSYYVDNFIVPVSKMMQLVLK